MARTRKSRRQQAEEKRQKRIRLVMAVVGIGLMVISMFAFIIVYYSSDSQTGYNFDYEIRDNSLLVRTEQEAIPFYNFPDERFTFTSQQAQQVQDAQSLVLVADASSNETFELAEFIRFDLSQYLQIQGGQTSQSNISSLPVITCDDATSQVPVFVLDTNATGLTQNENCFVFGARGQDAAFVRDAILYAYFDLL